MKINEIWVHTIAECVLKSIEESNCTSVALKGEGRPMLCMFLKEKSFGNAAKKVTTKNNVMIIEKVRGSGIIFVDTDMQVFMLVKRKIELYVLEIFANFSGEFVNCVNQKIVPCKSSSSI